jgi:hypothetical protein
MDARIIRIGDVPENLQPASFEEAFGEFSDFKGRGRARRQERKLDRIEKKQVRKTAKQTAKANKQVGRQQVRAAKQGARQERKIQRQGFLTNRKQMRTERRAIGQEQEGAYNEEPLNEPVDSGYYNETPQQEYEEQGYAPQSQGGGYIEKSQFMKMKVILKMKMVTTRTKKKATSMKALTSLTAHFQKCQVAE